MRDRFRRFMYGRYGSDSLNRFVSIASLALMALALLTGADALYWVGLCLLLWAYFRMFSRNISRRSAENAAFYRLEYRFKEKWRAARTRFAQRGVYRYYRCPHCRQQLRVPRGRGKIQITCPKCGTQFVKKS